MCIAMAAVPLIISVVGTAATLVQQSRATSAQNAFNDNQRDEAVKAMNENAALLELQKRQTTEQAGQKIFENNIAAQKAAATARVSAGENGVAGLSVDALLAELDGSRERYNDSIQATLKQELDSLDHTRENLHRGAKSTVNGLKTPQAPDYIGAALKIGSAATSYYAGTKTADTNKANK